MVRSRVIGMLLSGTVLSAAPRVAHYRAEIHANDHHAYSVDIAISTSGEAWLKPSYTLDGEALNRIVADDPGHLRYSIDNDSRRVRIPLAVPEIPTSGLPRSVEIEVMLPPGYIISGDMFPLFERKDSGVYVAELANIPGHLELEIAHTDQASFRQRWLTPAVFSDFAVIVFLVVGSIVRLLVRKPREV